ncbi:3-dehydroquinate synthase [Acetobacterium paludosum]|uniref:3-dehydroquinate synthase n=1 Tax=Acetobacterium paludosum TaxID=52693 RepID=A0A923KRF4_9FIRM|nr:3-dehydroquinate synthase [Acetobacterium paludosum]MBC3887212.1 3-dehydroquinate synthase [Acetobacterium paludosum]
MKELVCKTENTHQYPIIIEKGLKGRLSQMKALFSQYHKVVIITDKNVAKEYLNDIERQVRLAGPKVYSIVIPPGEQSKCLEETATIYDELVKCNITRTDAILTLGGGVVGDLGGFCAATYLRGIDLIQMPTSLLAQVDSSVGGKVGIDLDYGKNLVGAFHQPRAVLIDPLFLETLEDHFLMDGMGEVIKYGCISSAPLFVKLMSYTYHEDLMEDMEDIIAKCCKIKRDIVQEDEHEQGVRRILNFGHTVGHVVETYFKFKKYSHGEAVAIGMAQITKKTVEEGISQRDTYTNLIELLEAYGLPTKLPKMPLDKVQEILFTDKKFENDSLYICALEKIGKAQIVKMQKQQAIELFR